MYCANCGCKLENTHSMACHSCGFVLNTNKSIILSVSNLHKKYSSNFSLENISFEVHSSDKIALLGSNGSGKSTLLSILAGMNKPDSGEILLNGKKIDKSAKKLISYVPQEPMLIEDLNVKDNLNLFAGIYKIKTFNELLLLIPNFLGIEKMLKKKVHTLSGGMKKKVSIAIALIAKPQLLILDEPFSALDSFTIEQMNEYLKNSKELAVIYSSHDILEVSKICNKSITLNDGKISQINEQLN